MELYPLQIYPNSSGRRTDERTNGNVDRKKCSYAYASLFRKCAFGAMILNPLSLTIEWGGMFYLATHILTSQVEKFNQ